MDGVLRSPLRPAIRSPLRSPLAPALGGSPSLTAQVQALFAAGKVGGMWDMGDMSTLFQDTAGSTPITAVTQPIGRVNDKSGLGNHATQPTAKNRPLYQVVSSYGCAQFDATDDALLFPAITFGGAFNTFVASKATSGTRGIPFWRTADAGNGYWAVYEDLIWPPNEAGVGTPSYAVNGVALSPVTRRELYSRINGLDSVIETTGIVLSAETALQFSGYGGFQFQGNSHRILMISGTLTAAEKLLCRQWCAEGNGVAVV